MTSVQLLFVIVFFCTLFATAEAASVPTETTGFCRVAGTIYLGSGSGFKPYLGYCEQRSFQSKETCEAVTWGGWVANMRAYRPNYKDPHSYDDSAHLCKWFPVKSEVKPAPLAEKAPLVKDPQLQCIRGDMQFLRDENGHLFATDRDAYIKNRDEAVKTGMNFDAKKSQEYAQMEVGTSDTTYPNMSGAFDTSICFGIVRCQDPEKNNGKAWYEDSSADGRTVDGSGATGAYQGLSSTAHKCRFVDTFNNPEDAGFDFKKYKNGRVENPKFWGADTLANVDGVAPVCFSICPVPPDLCVNRDEIKATQNCPEAVTMCDSKNGFKYCADLGPSKTKPNPTGKCPDQLEPFYYHHSGVNMSVNAGSGGEYLTNNESGAGDRPAFLPEYLKLVKSDKVARMTCYKRAENAKKAALSGLAPERNPASAGSRSESGVQQKTGTHTDN